MWPRGSRQAGPFSSDPNSPGAHSSSCNKSKSTSWRRPRRRCLVCYTASPTAALGDAAPKVPDLFVRKSIVSTFVSFQLSVLREGVSLPPGNLGNDSCLPSVLDIEHLPLNFSGLRLYLSEPASKSFIQDIRHTRTCNQLRSRRAKSDKLKFLRGLFRQIEVPKGDFFYVGKIVGKILEPRVQFGHCDHISHFNDQSRQGGVR